MPSQKHARTKDFVVLGTLGEGGFGKVLLVRGVKTENVHAMKILKKQEILARGRKSVDWVVAERNVLSVLQHPFIVSLHYAFQDDQALYLVMTFVGGGDVWKLLEDHKRFPEPWAVFYAAQIVLALSHIHSCHVVYRDLKPENVLLGMDGYLVLSDFGLAKQFDASQPGSELRASCSVVGTPEYLAPEVVSGQYYGVAVDWWTLGCMVYEMLTGDSPFLVDDMAEMLSRIRVARYNLPNFLNDTARSLIRGLLCQDPSQRLGVDRAAASDTLPASGLDQLQAHPFFVGVDFRALLRKQIAAPFVPQNTYETKSCLSPGAAEECKSPDLQVLEGRFRPFGQIESRDDSPCLQHPSVPPAPVEPSLTVPQDEPSCPPLLNPPTADLSEPLSFELSPDGTIRYVSESLCTLLGFPRWYARDLLGRDCTEHLLHPDEADCFHAALRECARAALDAPPSCCSSLNSSVHGGSLHGGSLHGGNWFHAGNSQHGGNSIRGGQLFHGGNWTNGGSPPIPTVGSAFFESEESHESVVSHASSKADGNGLLSALVGCPRNLGTREPSLYPALLPESPAAKSSTGSGSGEVGYLADAEELQTVLHLRLRRNRGDRCAQSHKWFECTLQTLETGLPRPVPPGTATGPAQYARLSDLQIADGLIKARKENSPDNESSIRAAVVEALEGYEKQGAAPSSTGRAGWGSSPMCSPTCIRPTSQAQHVTSADRGPPPDLEGLAERLTSNTPTPQLPMALTSISASAPKAEAAAAAHADAAGAAEDAEAAEDAAAEAAAEAVRVQRATRRGSLISVMCRELRGPTSPAKSICTKKRAAQPSPSLSLPASSHVPTPPDHWPPPRGCALRPPPCAAARESIADAAPVETSQPLPLPAMPRRKGPRQISTLAESIVVPKASAAGDEANGTAQGSNGCQASGAVGSGCAAGKWLNWEQGGFESSPPSTPAHDSGERPQHGWSRTLSWEQPCLAPTHAATCAPLPPPAPQRETVVVRPREACQIGHTLHPGRCCLAECGSADPAHYGCTTCGVRLCSFKCFNKHLRCEGTLKLCGEAIEWC